VDVVQRIRSFNAGRDPERLPLKYRAMRASPFAFLRGTCHLFHDRLSRIELPASAPPVWVCGDLHLENFGSYKGDNRLVYFDINDFDEAVLAPASRDLARLLASVWIGADSVGLPSARARKLCQTLLGTYAAALAAGKALWVERETAQGLIGGLLDGLRDRSRPAFLDERTSLHGKKRLLRLDGKKALGASAAQRAEVEAFMRQFAAAQPDPDFFKVIDVARRIAGTGSLGVDRYVILVRGKGSPDGNYLLDLKQTLPSSLLPHLEVPQPRWPTEAHRVVALQRRMQAVSMAFLQPVQLGGRPFVLRALQPSQDRIALAPRGQTPADLEGLMEALGRLIAWAQLRSAGREGSAIAYELIAFGANGGWQAALLDASHDAAEQVRQDSALYDKAFDDGALGA
jgi:uncharacterized protein (DUF2252 family)